ncbi:hypothetical protein Scep_027383 [Stephania cephalantha]|uniref:Uncharacterized protein n=1 Tax=Stephania cephalantha TaxID=152367 RepID=A0AAP0E823_9MAGN
MDGVVADNAIALFTASNRVDAEHPPAQLSAASAAAARIHRRFHRLLALMRRRSLLLVGLCCRVAVEAAILLPQSAMARCWLFLFAIYCCCRPSRCRSVEQAADGEGEDRRLPLSSSATLLTHFRGSSAQTTARERRRGRGLQFRLTGGGSRCNGEPTRRPTRRGARARVAAARRGGAMTAATVSGTTGEGRRASVAPAAAADGQQQQRPGDGAAVGMMTSGGAAAAAARRPELRRGWLDDGAAPAAAPASGSSGAGERRQRRWRGSGDGGGSGNGVEQRRGGALPGRSIPDKTTMVDKAS